MPKPIYVLNGPNLNLLGVREPHIYGHTTLDDIRRMCVERADASGLTVEFRQTNHEGQLVDWVHEARTEGSAIVINPGAYGHTSIALLDALNAVTLPVVECHLSNLAKREAFRHHSYVTTAAVGLIAGFGANSYTLAIAAAADLVAKVAA